MESFINFNGSMIRSGSPVISADNRGFRYGDGLFETMKIAGGKVVLEEFHLDRLFSGLVKLGISVPVLFTRAYIIQQVLNTCRKNKIKSIARVRLTVFRGDGGLYEFSGVGGGFIIQAWQLPESYLLLNENGLVSGIYYGIQKSCDSFSNLKSNNYLPYVMGALTAKQEKWNDCLIMNIHGRICDSTIANIFRIKDRCIYTPPLSEGCVAGVTRRWLLEELRQSGYSITEEPCTIPQLEEADELFLTNAAYGIRWIGRLGDTTYGNKMTTELYGRFLQRHTG